MKKPHEILKILNSYKADYFEKGIFACDFFQRKSFPYSHNSRLPLPFRLEKYFSKPFELHIVIYTQPGL